MKPGFVEALSREEVSRIHGSSLEILESSGVLVQHEELREILRKSGASVTAKGNVRFALPMVEKLLGKAPGRLLLHSRDGEAPLELGSGVSRSVSGFDATFIFDPANGERRPITKEEVGNFARIADRLEGVDIVGNQGIPQDVPQERAEAHAVQACLENTAKHLIIAPDTGDVARLVYRMVKAVAGKADIGERPIVSCHISPSAPLRWTPKACDVLLETVREGVPFLILPAPMAGATSPVTLAGHLVVHNTEILSGYLIAQVLREGAQVVYCNAHTLFNMREGNPIIATPETMLLRIAGAQMARFYGIPSHSIGFDTDSHTVDQQGAWEKSLTAMVCVQAGIDLIVNLGMFSTGLTVSYAQLVLDAEVFKLLRRFRRGIEVTPERLAVNLIKKIGSWGAYLEEEHTLRFFKEENWYPSVSCRKLFEPWEKAGSRDAAAVAHERAEEILGRERPEYLDAITRKELDRIVGG